jgi:hypothetical protein
MSHSNLSFFLLLGAMMVTAFPVYSQQPASSAAPTGTPAPAATAPAAPAGPSAETLAKAKSLGLKTEVRKGVTQYCWEDASVGSRFTTKKCVGENQLNEIIAQREALKDNLRSSMSGSGSK